MRGAGVLEHIILGRLQDERVVLGNTANECPSRGVENWFVPPALGDGRVCFHGGTAWVRDDDPYGARIHRLHLIPRQFTEQTLTRPLANSGL